MSRSTHNSSSDSAPLEDSAPSTPPSSCPPSIILLSTPTAGRVNNAAAGPVHKPPAGLRGLDHYKRALPKWRYSLRQRMLPLIRWETPWLAAMQHRIRTPALDRYFAITANLGTHTFFIIGLPILFWCGFGAFGKGLVRILAAGVFFTGWLKDLLSLPRPLSPPLHRITMSGSAALEYGFPSTHSANAASVAVFGLLILRSGATHSLSPTVTVITEGLSYIYVTTIVMGRLYCGMHGFLDVIVGSILGTACAFVEFYVGPALNTYLFYQSWTALLLVALVVIALVRLHPEPADDCPCFDDSVALAGVTIGLEIGTWRLAHLPLGAVYAHPQFSLTDVGWPAMVARVVLGVLVIFSWRAAVKPTLLRGLPHLYRVIETHRLALPRRFFVPASSYTRVPPLYMSTDSVIPDVADLPRIVQSFRGPGRGRSVSIGPQSAADAYEALANRELRRQSSMDNIEAANNMRFRGTPSAAPSLLETKDAEGGGPAAGTETPSGSQDDLGAKEMFAQLEKPRVRYDVEVMTALVVYTGIAWLATDLILELFELVGLGVMHLPLVS